MKFYELTEITIHGGSLTDGFAEFVNTLLLFLEGLSNHSINEILSSLVPGFSALPSIHPVLVPFPISCLSIFFVLDVLGSLSKNNELRKFAGVMLYLGMVTALVTVLAGFQAAAKEPHGEDVHYIVDKHKLYGILVALLAVVLSVWRYLLKAYPKKEANALYLSLSFLLCAVLVLGADLGGLLVYKYGIGVEAVVLQAGDHEH